MGLLVLVVLSACGRVAFDPIADGGGDAITPDADPIVAAGLQLWLEMNPGDERRDTITQAVADCVMCPISTTGVRGGGGAFPMGTCMTFPSSATFQVQTLTLAVGVRPDAAFTSASVVGKAYNPASIRWNSFELFMPNAG